MISLPRLLLVTDRHRAAPRDIVEIVTAAIKGGVEFVQLREKDLPAGELFALAQRLRAITRGHARLVINDRADVALACDADGVHLGEASLPVSAARKIVGPQKLVGRSVHTVTAAREAERDGADYLIAGAIFPTASHPDMAPQGLNFLREVCAAVHVPVFAIGGITHLNARDCLTAGAHGVAVVGEIIGAENPEQRARELSELLTKLLRFGSL
ncbi:MAG: thiamine phosphate synthase [Abditibacteriales bacterium]|nr:thiamine phosphate synthase [Abditibacteriales bacterium]MDW8367362.1 thiamine phosphate synthase [Abditibacteriales bacterium]